MITYFDSSVLLAILLNEERQEAAYQYWTGSAIRISSILLKIETIISLRRIYEHNRAKLRAEWLTEKTSELDEYLKEMYFKTIDDEIEQIIYLNKDLAKCRALDAVHVATALKYKEMNNGENINLYSFDKTMHNLAEHFGFNTNRETHGYL